MMGLDVRGRQTKDRNRRSLNTTRVEGKNIVKGCGTKGSGKDRTGQFQVINESGSGYDPHFKCCLIRLGWPNPSQEMPPKR